MLLRNFASSNGSLALPRFINLGMTSSAVSNVVNRSPQLKHSLRRRTCRPSAVSRESATLVSEWLQKGQCITQALSLSGLPIDGKLPA